MNPLLHRRSAQIAAAYRAAYAEHLQLVQRYADGLAASSELRASADNQKLLRAAYRAVSEAEQVSGPACASRLPQLPC